MRLPTKELVWLIAYTWHGCFADLKVGDTNKSVVPKQRLRLIKVASYTNKETFFKALMKFVQINMN